MKKFNISKKRIVIAIVIVLLIVVLTLLLFLKPKVDYSKGIINDIKFEIHKSDNDGDPYIEITNNSKNELTKFILVFEPKESLSNKKLEHLMYDHIGLYDKNYPVDKNFNRSRIKMVGGFDAKDSVYDFVSEGVRPNTNVKYKYNLYFEIYDEDLEDTLAFCDPDHNYDCNEWLTDYEFFDYFELKKVYYSFRNGDYIDNYVYDYVTNKSQKISSEKCISEIDYVLNSILVLFKGYEVEQNKEETSKKIEYEFTVYNVNPDDVEELVESFDNHIFNGFTHSSYDMWTTSDHYGNNHLIFSYYEYQQELHISLYHQKNADSHKIIEL